VSGVIWILRFAHRQHAERICDQVRIIIDSNNGEIFITEHEIKNKLLASKLHPEGKIADLNTHAIEHFLLQNSAIQAVNVFTQISGEVDIKVLQRQPIVRIENAQRQQFYIGSDGHLMATNPNHTARLIVANGTILESFSPNKNILKSEKNAEFSTPILNKIYQLVTYIRNDNFLNTFIDQIYVNSKHEFELVPKVGNQIILLGDAENFEDQFKRLHQFYHYGIKKVDKNTYRIINLKYNNQVIGTRI
jgi:cell division protein FtsQ